MSHPQDHVSAKRIRLVAIEIPAFAGDGSKLSTLLAAGGLDSDDGELVGVKVLGLVAAGTDRGAFVAHHDGTEATMTASGQHVIAGADWYEPAVEAGDVYVRAAAGAAVPAIAVCYLD